MAIPVWEVAPALSSIVSDGADVDVQSDLDGNAYVVVVPDGQTAPDSDQVKAGTDFEDNPVAAGYSASSALTASTPAAINLTGLAAGIYDIYVVAEDTTPDLQAAPVKLDLDISIPVFAATFPSVGNIGVDTAEINAQINQNGNTYMVVVPDGDPAPSIAQIKSGEDSTGAPVAAGLSGTTALTADTPDIIPVTNLTPATLYDVYVVAENDLVVATADSPVQLDLDLDQNLPVYADGYPALDNIQDVSTNVLVQTNEDGNTYAVAVLDDAPAPSIAQVKAGEDGLGNAAVATNNDTLTADTETTLTLTGLDESTDYDIYVIAEDASGNSDEPVRLDLNRGSVVVNNLPVDVLSGLDNIDRASRKISSDAFLSLPGTWAELVNGELQEVTTATPGKIHKFPLTGSSANEYETNDVKVGRIATMETVGARVVVNISGYVPGIAKGEKLIVSVEAGEEGKLRSPIGATAGTYEIVARCENIDNDTETMSWVLGSPEFITVS